MSKTDNFEQWVHDRMRQFAEPSAAEIAISRDHVREYIHTGGHRTVLDSVAIEIPYSTTDRPSRRTASFLLVLLLVTAIGSLTLLQTRRLPQQAGSSSTAPITPGDSRPETGTRSLGQQVVVPNSAIAPTLKFEVAAIRVEERPRNYVSYQVSGDRLTTEGTSLAALIRFAYDVAAFQVIGGPDWAIDRDVQFRIQAKAETASSAPQIRQMLRALLADRFKLKLIHRSKQTQGYLLQVDSKGAKLGKAEGLGTPGCLPFPANCTRTTMAEFADYLTKVVFRMPVSDRTALSGLFDFTLEWRPDSSQFGGNGGVGFFAGSPIGPSIFTALREQLGLRLEPATVDMEILEIDNAEMPSDN